jgi:hypothetical protein
MRKGEIAKIYMKKKHGFGRELKKEELRFPNDYQKGANKDRLLNE